MFWSMPVNRSPRAPIVVTPKRSCLLCHIVVHTNRELLLTPVWSWSMPEPMDAEDFAGPHPTCREFVARLAAWGFTERGEEHVHTVFRGPHGGRKRAAHDSIMSLVLAIHAEADRPLGFDQVAELAGNRVTRAQVSAASAALCRDGQLDRIRAGVYQWAAGQRAATTPPAAPAARQGACPRPNCSTSCSPPASR